MNPKPMSEKEWTALECPECGSKRAAIVPGGERAKCVDCGKVYPIKTIADPAAKKKKGRTAASGVRHRRDNGPAELEVEPVPAPTPKERGFITQHTFEIIRGGPRALIAAQHRAAKLSAKFHEPVEPEWCLMTPWLKSLLDNPETVDGYDATWKNKKRVRYALQWRPRVLGRARDGRRLDPGSALSQDRSCNSRNP